MIGDALCARLPLVLLAARVQKLYAYLLKCKCDDSKSTVSVLESVRISSWSFA